MESTNHFFLFARFLCLEEKCYSFPDGVKLIFFNFFVFYNENLVSVLKCKSIFPRAVYMYPPKGRAPAVRYGPINFLLL